MSFITGMRMVAGLSAGSMTSSQLTTALATPAGAAGWKAAVYSPVLARQLVQEPTAREAWMASPNAVNVAVLSRDFMRTWFDHPDALDSLMGKESSVKAMLESREARIALWSHDKALGAWSGSTVAMSAALVSSAARTHISYPNSNAFTALLTAGRIIALGWTMDYSSQVTLYGVRVGSVYNGQIIPQGSKLVLPMEGTLTAKSNNNGSLSFKYFKAD